MVGSPLKCESQTFSRIAVFVVACPGWRIRNSSIANSRGVTALGRPARATVHTSLPDFRMPDDEQVHLAAEGFRMLADSTRIKIL